MIYELIVTSAKRVLQAGRSGFAAVMRTRGMHPELQSRLESLSGYRHLYPQGDPRNPAIYTHSVLDSVAGKFSVFSRTIDAGSDYSGRSNKLAHHVACDASEMRTAASSSPAAALQWLEQNGRFASRWEGDPREQDPAAPISFTTTEPAKCTFWEAVSGDAGWAGVLVERTLKGVPTWLIVPAEVDALTLLAEAMALIESSKRWNVSFTTHAISDAGFVWKVASEGSAEAKAARELTAATIIDLTRKSRVADDGPYVLAARGLTDVPWKPGATKTVPPGFTRSAIPKSGESKEVTASAIHELDLIAVPHASRPKPPPLVKPPPLARPPYVPLDPVSLSETSAGPITPRAYIATTIVALAVGLLVTVALGVLIDNQLRGARSVLRAMATLVQRGSQHIPPDPGITVPSDGNTTQIQTEAVAVPINPTQPEEARPEFDLAIPGTESPETPLSSSPSGATLAMAGDNPSPASVVAATSPLTPGSYELLNNGSDTATTGGNWNTAQSPFATVRQAVESQQHLPSHSVTAVLQTRSTPPQPALALVSFEQGSVLPPVEDLILLSVSTSGSFTIKSASRTADERRWTCHSADDFAPAELVGAFVLSVSGLSFEPHEGHDKDLERLSSCCLLIRGTTTSEETYLQLSRPIEVAPIPFILTPMQQAPQGILESQISLPVSFLADIGPSTEHGHMACEIIGTTSSDLPAFTVSLPPLAGQRTASFILNNTLVESAISYRIDMRTDSHSLSLTVNPFADKAVFDKVCRAIAKGMTVNHDQTFLPYARSELLHGMPMSEELVLRGKPKGSQQPRVSAILAKLKPDKPAASFDTYTATLKEVLLNSPTLSARAESIVDGRNSPTLSTERRSEPRTSDPLNEGEDRKPAVDREAEVNKEKVRQFPAWWEARLRELESRTHSSTTQGGARWTDEELDEFAALILWSRIHHLEGCVKAFRLPDVPSALDGTVRLTKRHIWPLSCLPEGVSCRPEAVLMRTTP